MNRKTGVNREAGVNRKTGVNREAGLGVHKLRFGVMMK